MRAKKLCDSVTLSGCLCLELMLANAGIPWFWSNQADLKLQIAGLCNGFDATVLRRDGERGKFSVLYYRQGRIIAADCVNAPLDFLAVKYALAKGRNIPAHAAADPATQFKTITTDS